MVKRAVVVGVNDYSIQGVSNLGGCVRDAQSFYHLLIEAFGFDPSQVYYYVDKAASSENIKRALRYIIANSEPGDVACFYYAGHGARLPQPGQPSRYYETIIPASGQWITDHELYEIAKELQQSVVNFTVILDSCHSGGMHEETENARKIRSAVLSNELIQAMVKSMQTLIPCGICLPHDAADLNNNVKNVRIVGNSAVCADEDPNKILVPLAKSTLIAGCRFDEFSREEPTLGHGLLTQAFLDTVDQCNFSIDYHQLMEKLQSRVAYYMQKYFPGDKQTPQLRGQMNRMEEGFLAPWSDCR